MSRMNKYYYDGPITEPSMPFRVANAFHRIKAQRTRCNYKKHKSYKTYGGRGLVVSYSTKEFIGWFLENTKHIPDNELTSWHVGRIDHNKGYSFENIIMQTAKENLNEVHLNGGSGAPRKKVYFIDKEKGEGTLARSMFLASELSGVPEGTVCDRCRLNTEPLRDNRYRFYYYESKFHKEALSASR